MSRHCRRRVQCTSHRTSVSLRRGPPWCRFHAIIRPLIRVVDDRFEGRRAVGDPIRYLERDDETAASGTLVPASGQRFPPSPKYGEQTPRQGVVIIRNPASAADKAGDLAPPCAFPRGNPDGITLKKFSGLAMATTAEENVHLPSPAASGTRDERATAAFASGAGGENP